MTPRNFIECKGTTVLQHFSLSLERERGILARGREMFSCERVVYGAAQRAQRWGLIYDDCGV